MGLDMTFNFVKYKKFYFLFSGALIAASFVCLFLFGLNLGIDFTGGSILELEYKDQPPAVGEVRQTLSDYGFVYVQRSGQNGIIIRMKTIPEKTHQEIIKKLSEGHKLEEKRFESIGPTIGNELKEKTKTLIILALFSIVIYIAFAFRRVQRPIPSWYYGIASLIALFHDILMPIAAFSLLGRFYGAHVTIPVVTALLTILGYSINNTVVVFDRIREILIKKRGITFEETLNQAIRQTLSRQINTSLTTLFPLLFIFFLGGETLKYFSLALILGIIAGTYSSLFLAGPFLLLWSQRKNRLTK